MLAPLIVKPQAKTTGRSSDKSALRPAQAYGHDWDIERPQTSRFAPQTAPRFADKPPSAAWGFSRIPLYPPGQTSGSERSTPTPAPRLPIQAKLEVGAANDPLEHEADRVADQVMRMPDPRFSGGTVRPQISRECDACAQEEKLQTKEAGTQAAIGEVPSSVHDVLRAPGEPLDPATRAFFEPRFGHDFSRVRVHTGTSAERSARDLTAHGYTVGHNMVFEAGRFAPSTSEGRTLLAHELAHVVQQSGGALAIQRKPAGDERWRRDERAARYRGQLIAKRITNHTKVSNEVRAKIKSELAYFEGNAKNVYIAEIEPALRAVGETEMLGRGGGARGPHPITLSLLNEDAMYGGSKRMPDDEIYAAQIEAKKREDEEAAQRVEQRNDRRAKPVVGPTTWADAVNMLKEARLEGETDFPPAPKRALELVSHVNAWLQQTANYENYDRYFSGLARDQAMFMVGHAKGYVQQLMYYCKVDVEAGSRAIHTGYWEPTITALEGVRDQLQVMSGEKEFKSTDFYKVTEAEKSGALITTVAISAAAAAPALIVVGAETLPELTWAATRLGLRVVPRATIWAGTNPNLAAGLVVGGAPLAYKAIKDPGSLDLWDLYTLLELYQGHLDDVRLQRGTPRPSEPTPPQQKQLTSGLPPPAPTARFGPDAPVFQGGNQGNKIPRGNLYDSDRPPTPSQSPDPPTPAAPRNSGVDRSLPAQNDNAVTTQQAQRQKIAVGGGAPSRDEPSMVRRVVPSPRAKPQKGSVTSRPDVSDSDPLQQKTVKPTAPPEDTHSVQPTAPGTNVEPRSTQVGNFAEKNFNGLTDMVLDQGIPANGTGSGRIPRGKVISGAIPAGAEPKYKIEGWKGTAPGGRELEIDFLDRAAGEVIEIKPDNRYDEGMSKAKFYSETMDKVDPLPDVKLPDGTIERQRWKPKCETYDGEAVGALHDYLFPPKPRTPRTPTSTP
jgi:Domain of unknown function (DUF4157)